MENLQVNCRILNIDEEYDNLLNDYTDVPEKTVRLEVQLKRAVFNNPSDLYYRIKVNNALKVAKVINQNDLTPLPTNESSETSENEVNGILTIPIRVPSPGNYEIEIEIYQQNRSNEVSKFYSSKYIVLTNFNYQLITYKKAIEIIRQFTPENSKIENNLFKLIPVIGSDEEFVVDYKELLSTLNKANLIKKNAVYSEQTVKDLFNFDNVTFNGLNLSTYRIEGKSGNFYSGEDILEKFNQR